jgi:AcrR family transcriptional regulator
MMHSADGACVSEPTGTYFHDFIEGRRGEILDAALAVFAEKGYDGGTMREIAARLGVTEPALYRHYAGKEALFEDLVAVASDRVVGSVARMLEGLAPEGLRDSLQELIRIRRGQTPSSQSVKPVMRALFTSAPHNAEFRMVFRTHLARPMLSHLEAYIPRADAYFGIARTPEQLTSSLRAFVSLFVGYFVTSTMLEMPDDDAGIVDAMMAIMGWSA